MTSPLTPPAVQYREVTRVLEEEGFARLPRRYLSAAYLISTSLDPTQQLRNNSNLASSVCRAVLSDVFPVGAPRSPS